MSEPCVSQRNRLPLRQIAEGSANDFRSGVLHHHQLRARCRRKVQGDVHLFSHRSEAVGAQGNLGTRYVSNIEVTCKKMRRRKSEHQDHGGDDMTENLKARGGLKLWFHGLILVRLGLTRHRFVFRSSVRAMRGTPKSSTKPAEKVKQYLARRSNS